MKFIYIFFFSTKLFTSTVHLTTRFNAGSNNFLRPIYLSFSEQFLYLYVFCVLKFLSVEQYRVPVLIRKQDYFDTNDNFFLTVLCQL